jgi:hypothetical protein
VKPEGVSIVIRPSARSFGVMLAQRRRQAAATTVIAQELRQQAESLLRRSRVLHACGARTPWPAQRRLLELQAQDCAARARALALIALRMVDERRA